MLFMWVTFPKLQLDLDVIKEWGIELFSRKKHKGWDAWGMKLKMILN